METAKPWQVTVTHTLQNSVLNQCSERLAAGLGFYKQTQNQNQLSSEVQNLKEKWQSGSEISPDMRNLITQLAEELNLEAKSAFNLIDGFFQLNPHRQHLAVGLENSIAQFQVEQQQLQNQLHAQQLRQTLQSKFDKFTSELEKFQTVIKTEVINFYFKERITLIHIVSFLIAQRYSKSVVGNSADIFIGKLQNSGLTKNLVLSLIRNLDWKEEFKSLVNDKTENLLENLYAEQVQFLKVLFTIWYTSENATSQAETGLFFEYLQKSGYIGELERSRFAQNPSQTHSRTANLIQVLSQMAALAMMQLHNKPALTIQNQVSLFDAQSLSLSSAFVIFPAFMILGNQPLFEWFSKGTFIAEVESILESELLTNEAHSDLRGPAMVLLRYWLDMAYEFMSKQKQSNQARQLFDIQKLAMRLLGERCNIETMWNKGVENVMMFSQIISKPADNFPQYLELMAKISGKTAYPYGDKVFDFNYKKNTFQEIYGWMSIKVKQLQGQILITEDVLALGNACVLICKIIKQKPKYYKELNENYKKIAKEKKQQQFESEKSHLKLGSQRFSMGQNIVLEEGENPLLSLLVKALLGFFYVLIEIGGKPISKILGVLKTIFKNYDDLKVEVISLLKENSNIPQIIQFMISTTMTVEKEIHTYKLTESFLDFITELFDQQAPQNCLALDDLIHIDTSFLSNALTNFYQPIIQHYFEFQFKDEIAAASFSYHLLKLTKVLLKKFVSIPEKQKCGLYSPMPRFEILMEMITFILKNVNIHEICLKTLQLTQVERNESQGFENRFVEEFTNKGIVLSTKMATKMQKMVQMSLKVLNQLIKLSQQDDASDQDRYSKNVKYTRQLTSVWQLQSQLQSSISFGNSNISIVGQIAFYVSPSNYLDQHFIISEALHFLTCSMPILKSNSLDMYDLLKRAYSHQLKEQFLTQFKACFSQLKFMMARISWVEFWIQAVESQPKLIDKMMTAPDSEVLVSALKTKPNPNRNLDNEIKLLRAKILSLVCQMSEKDCCSDMITYKNFQLVTVLFESCIEQSLSDAAQHIALNGRYLSEDAGGEDTNIVSSCIAKINVAHFLKLLQNEFSRSSKSPEIRDLICRLSNHSKFKQLSFDSQCKQNLRDISKTLNNINTDLRERHGQNISTQNKIHNHLMNLPSFSADIDHQNYLQSDGDVCLNSEDLRGVALFKAIEPHCLWQYLPMRQFIEPAPGSVGGKFFIDTDELSYKLQQEQYEDQCLINNAITVSTEMNLTMSVLFCDYQVVKCKSEFIVNIGSVQMRENQVRGHDHNISQSFFPLVNNIESHLIKKTDNAISSLIKLCHESADMLYKTLTAQNQLIDFNFLHQKLTEVLIDQLVIQLGIISSLVVAISPNELKSLEILMHNLLNGLPDIVTNTMNQQLFMQLTQQTFQILQFMKGNKVTAQSIVKIIGRVLEQMRKGKLFSQGVSILCSGMDLMDDQTVQQVMSKENNEPLRLILGKLSDSNVNAVEVQEILLMVQKYAERGPIHSLHLFKQGILEILSNNETIKRIQTEDAYVTMHNVQVRNQCHAQWCQMLVILRTITGFLMENPLHEHREYFLSCCELFKRFRTRIAIVLNIVIEQAAPGAHGGQVLTVALLEEVEMLCSVLSQMFDHADLWCKQDIATYSYLKQYMMFAVPRLFSECDSKAILPSSKTEQHLAYITTQSMQQELGHHQLLMSDGSYTALQVKIEICLQRIMLSCTSSLLSILNHQKVSAESPLLNTQQEDFRQMSYDQQQDTEESGIKQAFSIFRLAQNRLVMKFKRVTSDKTLEILLERLKDLFRHDLHISKEYQGGLGSLFLVSSAKELIDLMDVTIVMSMHVSCELLEQVRLRSASGEGHFSQTYYNNDPYLELRDIVQMAAQLSDLIQECKTDVKSWDDSYFSKLWDFVESVKQNPDGSNQQMF